MSFIAKILLRIIPKGIFAMLRIVTDMREAQKDCRLATRTLACESVRAPCVEDYGEFPIDAKWARTKIAFRERHVCMFDLADVFVRTGDVMVGGMMISGCGSGVKGTIMVTPGARLLKVFSFFAGGIRRVPENNAGYVFVKANGYYHFVMESLVQMMLALKCHPQSEVLVAKNEYRGYVREYMELLQKNGAVGRVRLVDGEVIRVPNYVVCNLESDSSSICTSSIELLRSALCGDVVVGNGRRVFITRRGRRAFDNQEEIENFMAALGFEIVDTAPMDIASEIRFFSSVSFVVANHGAGLTNIIYAPKGIKVVELFSPKWLHDVYFRLSKACGHSYSLCMAETPPTGTGWGNIDCDKLGHLISELIGH